MKQLRFISFVFLMLFMPVCYVAAQEISDFTQLSEEEYSNIVLPPLSVLFENAKSTPIYEFATVKTAIERKILAKEKRAVLSFFSLRGSYQYGMFGNESTYTDVALAPFLSYSTQAQNGYTIGAGINIPLDQLFDLGARVRRQKLNLKSTELERDIKHDEQKREIIELYTKAAAQLNVLKLRSESMVLANVQYEIAEKDFANSVINSGELASTKEKQSQARESYENSKSELTKSLMMLEVISGTPIIKK